MISDFLLDVSVMANLMEATMLTQRMNDKHFIFCTSDGAGGQAKVQLRLTKWYTLQTELFHL